MDQQLALYQLPQQIQDKAMIAEQLFLEYGMIFGAMGYTAAPILHYIDSVMKHPNTKQTFTCHTREMVFILSYYDADYEVMDRMIITIHRLPYTGVHDFISLDKLLLKRKIPHNPSMFFARSYPGNVDQQFQALFTAVMKLLQENFLPILDGEDWEEGCYNSW